MLERAQSPADENCEESSFAEIPGGRLRAVGAGWIADIGEQHSPQALSALPVEHTGFVVLPTEGQRGPFDVPFLAEDAVGGGRIGPMGACRVFQCPAHAGREVRAVLTQRALPLLTDDVAAWR